MSRNLRDRPKVSPPKKEARHGSECNDSSSDDDYNAVDLISDTEEDEPDVEVAEEEAIIASEGEACYDADAVQSSPRPSVDDNDDDDDDDDEGSWAGFEFTSPDGLLDDNLPSSFDDQMAQLNASESEVDMYSSFANGLFAQGFQSPSTGRRVRFDLSDSSSSPSGGGDPIYPNVFFDQGSLCPDFRRRIEQDDEASSMSDDDNAASIDDDELTIMDLFDDASSESSGYDTDEGETTEEDLPTLIRGPEVHRSPRSVASSVDEEIGPSGRRDEPRLADWTHDANKPFVVLDSRIKKLIVFGGKIARRYTFDTSEVFSQPFQMEAGLGLFGDSESPMVGDSANLMMSAFMRPLAHSNGAALGPPEAFYPYLGAQIGDGADMGSPSTLDTEDEEHLDDEMMWMEDLINCGDSTTDESVDHQQDATDYEYSSPVGPSSTPARPTSIRSEDQVNPLLVNKGLVGAFRKAQDQHQLLSRNVVSRESLAFSGPYRHGTLRGIKSDRLAAANTPITPIRNERALSAAAPLTLSPESPLAATAPKKRKFPGEQKGHKRSRSLV